MTADRASNNDMNALIRGARTSDDARAQLARRLGWLPDPPAADDADDTEPPAAA